MITVVANRFVKEESVSEAMALYKQLVEATLAEDGCIRYELYQDEKDTTHFVMIEDWASKESLENHFQSPHFTSIVPKLEGLSRGTGEVFKLHKI